MSTSAPTGTPGSTSTPPPAGLPAPVSNLPGSNNQRPTGHDIDSVTIRIPASVDPDALRHLDGIRDSYGDDAWLKTTVRVHNLHVTVTESEVIVRNGLATYLSETSGSPYGNATVFDHDALRPALLGLADVLGIPHDVLLTGRVTRLDVGVNVPLDYPVRRVTDNLTSDSRARVKDLGPASKVVGYTTRELYVYDKRAERGARDVDPVYGDQALARVELRYKKDIGRQLGGPMTVARLCDRAFYEELGERLIQSVDEQPFRRQAMLSARVQTPTDLYRAYAVPGIEALGGFDAAKGAIDLGQELGTLDKHRASKLRRALRKLRQDPTLTESLDVADDFRQAVRKAIYGHSH